MQLFDLFHSNPQHIGDDVTTSVSEFFEHSRAMGDYVALFEPFKPSRLKRSLLNRRYRELSSRAIKSRTRKGIGRSDTTEQTLDFIESERLERMGRELERFTADYALKAYLYLVARAENRDLAELLVEDITALIKAIFSQDAKDVPDVKKLSSERFDRSLAKLAPTDKLHPFV